MISDMMPGDATKMLLVTTLNFVLICLDLGKLSATASWCYLVSFGGPMQASAERRNRKHLKSQKTQHVDAKRNEQNVKSRSKPKVAWTEPIPLNPRHSGTRGYFNWLHLLSVCSTGLFHQEQSQNSQRPVDMCQTSVERRTRIFTHTHTHVHLPSNLFPHDRRRTRFCVNHWVFSAKNTSQKVRSVLHATHMVVYMVYTLHDCHVWRIQNMGNVTETVFKMQHLASTHVKTWGCVYIYINMLFLYTHFKWINLNTTIHINKKQKIHAHIHTYIHTYIYIYKHI